MKPRGRVFRIFISSTFEDLKAERDALDQDVFPKLRTLCEEHGFGFQPIDLRWGVSGEASLDHRTVPICMQEIARCQDATLRPNFVILLGDRYGWQPLPLDLSPAEFAVITASATDVDQTLLSEWYVLDANAVPAVYSLRPRAYEPMEPARTSEQEQWTHVESELRRIMLAAPLSEARKRDAATSATELEIERGAFQLPEAQSHVACFVRSIRNPPVQATPFIDRDAARSERLRQLKARLQAALGANYRTHSAEWTGSAVGRGHLEALCQDVFNFLRSIIRSEIDRLRARDPYSSERDAHETVIEQQITAGSLVGREDLLYEIDRYIDGPGLRPLALVGAPGSGRTALLAWSARRTRERLPSAHVFCRFIGATPDSLNDRSLLEKLCVEMARVLGDSRPLPRDLPGVVERFRSLLGRGTAHSPLVVILDGLDEAPAAPRWLPPVLPPNAFVVASCASGDLSNAVELPVGRLTDADVTALLTRWLEQAQRTLQPEQRALIESSVGGSPLGLRIAFEQALLWRSYDRMTNMGRGLSEIVLHLLVSLETPARHGEPLVRECLALLAASRYGLAEEELLALLSSPLVLADVSRRSPDSPHVTRLPVVIWSRLRADLEPFLAEQFAGGSRILTFRNRALMVASRTRYLNSPEAQIACHQTLAAHFRSAADPHSDGSWTGSSQRAFRELPFHLHASDRLESENAAICTLAANSTFCMAQFRATHDLAPVLETQDFALERATTTRDVAACIQAIAHRQDLDRKIQRSFGFQFVHQARSDPELALTLAKAIEDAARRTVALVVVAWVAAADEERVFFCRRVLEEAAADQAAVAAHQVPFLLNLVGELVERGFAEALELAHLIPDCPHRRAAARAWSHTNSPRARLGQLLSGPARRSVAAEEWRRVSRIGTFAHQRWNSGVSNRAPGAVEEEIVKKFGVDAPEIAYFSLAALFQVTGDVEGGTMTIGRALYVGRIVTFLDKAPYTRMALMDVAEAAKQRDLASEIAAQLVSAFSAPWKMSKASDTVGRVAPHVLELAAWSANRGSAELLQDHTLAGVLSAARQFVTDLVPQNPAHSRWELHKATAAARQGQVQEVNAILDPLAAQALSSERPDASLLVALHALASLADHATVQAAIADRLRNQGIAIESLGSPSAQSPETASVFACLIAADKTEVAAVALGLRLHQRPVMLFALVSHLCRHGAAPEVIDAAISQLVYLEPQPTRVRANFNALARHDRHFPVAQSLGIYYFSDIWTVSLGTGLVFTALGSAVPGQWTSAAAIVGLGAFGAVLDLWLWRRTGLWQQPEVSRRWGSSSGSALSFWGIVFHLQDQLPRWARSNEIAYGFGSAIAGVVATAALTLWASFTLRLKRKSAFLRFAPYAVATIAAIPASRWLATRVGPDLQTGFLLGGSFLVALGVNFLIKSVRVRRHYGQKGSTMFAEIDEDDDSLSSDTSTIDLPKQSALERKVLTAQVHFNRGNHRLAFRLYSEAAADPSLSEMSPKQQSTIFLMRGFMRRHLGQSREAVADYERAAQLCPESPSAYLNIALVRAQELQDPRGALNAFDQSVQCDPGNPETYSSRGIVRGDLEDFVGAIEDFDTALSLDPDHTNAMVNKGNALLRAGDYHSALRLYDRALEINPADPPLKEQRDRLRRALVQR
ncbi:MAG: tetratricopeptide repeat protein [Longimicrobiales bacterium]